MKDGNYCTGIDYSDREDCTICTEITDEEFAGLQDGMDCEVCEDRVKIYCGEKYEKILKERKEKKDKEEAEED